MLSRNPSPQSNRRARRRPSTAGISGVIRDALRLSRCNVSNLARLPAALLLAIAFLAPASASGPRWVAGSSYFDPAAKGVPVHWQNGAVYYYTDQGDLSALEPQNTANILVGNAASAWTNVATANVLIVRKGKLAEDVSGSNVLNTANGLTLPADIRSTATAYPVAVVYDKDGTVLNALLGAGASNPDDCRDNGVYVRVDNLATNGTIAHALMVVNGLCAADASHIALLQYLLVRAWGRVLGLDWSPANEGMFTDGTLNTNGLTGWPILHPFERLCTPAGTNCMPTATLRSDDVASVNRLYPVTAANLSCYPGKKLTAPNTISIQGTIHFRSGQGMQGVAVVAQPWIPYTTVPDVRYTVAAVSGALFQGNQGDSVAGANDPQGIPWKRFGSDHQDLEGWFDLSGIPLPPRYTQADYQITLVALNRLDTGASSVGPYTLSQVTPSGTMPSVVLHGLTAGSSVEQDFTIANSAGDDHTGADGLQHAPAPLPAGGEWVGRISGYGHTGWFTFWLRANRQFTVEAQALDDHGLSTNAKARLMLGLWNANDAPGATPDLGTPVPFNGAQTGLSLLRAGTQSDGQVLLVIDDQRGDGRPDYAYRGRVLYADTVTPANISLSGGTIVIHGIGFRPGNLVTVNGINAPVLSLTPTRITAVAPAAGQGVSGQVDVTVTDPLTQGSAVLQQALSYDAAGNNGLAIVAAPAATVPIGVPEAFTVRASTSDGVTPAVGVTVTFKVSSGSASLACGLTTCSAVTNAAGIARLSVAATTSAQAAVSAALTNGICVQARFSGSPPPQIAPLRPVLYLAQGAAFAWAPQALVLSQGSPLAGVNISWAGGPGANPAAGLTPSSSSGIATGNVALGPLGSGATAQLHACLPSNVACASFSVISVHVETAALAAIAGAGQSMNVSQQPAPVILRITDAVGDPMAGATVNFYQVLRVWTPACSGTNRCPSGAVLASTQTQLTSDERGMVTLAALTRNTAPTRLSVTATVGSQSTLSFQIERHP